MCPVHSLPEAYQCQQSQPPGQAPTASSALRAQGSRHFCTGLVASISVSVATCSVCSILDFCLFALQLLKNANTTLSSQPRLRVHLANYSGHLVSAQASGVHGCHPLGHHPGLWAELSGILHLHWGGPRSKDDDSLVPSPPTTGDGVWLLGGSQGLPNECAPFTGLLDVQISSFVKIMCEAFDRNSTALPCPS